MNKYYETQEFKNLQKEWYEKMKTETDFVDIEDPNYPDGFVQPEIINTNNRFGISLNRSEAYSHIIESYQFSRPVEKTIFQLHAEGKSTRQIEKAINKELSYSQISRVINRILQANQLLHR